MPIDDLTALGQKMREARKNKELTQQELSDLSHVSVKQIANIEKGKMNPSYLILRALAKVLHISLDTLINPDVSLRKLIHSGREIGYDIMGTMINVLLFVLASGMIPMFILKMNNEIRFITIIRYHIPYDICRFLIESIGIVLAIPVSVFISNTFYYG